MTKAELILELKNARESIHTLKDLEAAMRRMNGTKLQLRVDKAALDREILAARKTVEDFKNDYRHVFLFESVSRLYFRDKL